MRSEKFISLNLTSNRSLSVKSNPFAFEANSEKDIHLIKTLKDIQGNLKVFVSFTKKASDILCLKALQPNIEIIPKVENILDDTTLLEIMDCCATILLGRGDLSTAYKPNEIFDFQKRLIELCKKHNKKLIIGTGLLTNISDKQAPTIPEVMDYSYLRDMGIEAFLISGSNAHDHPLATLEFMKTFE